MSYVFDASSILALTRRLEGKVVEVMKGNLTAALALYEVGNALWKECSLLKRLKVPEAAKTLKFLVSLLDAMKIFDTEDSSLAVEALSNAMELNITYYDSVYLTIAGKVGGILVTDDEELLEAARKKDVKAFNSKVFPNQAFRPP